MLCLGHNFLFSLLIPTCLFEQPLHVLAVFLRRGWDVTATGRLASNGCAIHLSIYLFFFLICLFVNLSPRPRLQSTSQPKSFASSYGTASYLYPDSSTLRCLNFCGPTMNTIWIVQPVFFSDIQNTFAANFVTVHLQTAHSL